MSRRVRVELTEAQARALFAAALAGEGELTEVGLLPGPSRAALKRAVRRLIRAYGRDAAGNRITGRPRH